MPEHSSHEKTDPSHLRRGVIRAVKAASALSLAGIAACSGDETTQSAETTFRASSDKAGVARVNLDTTWWDLSDLAIRVKNHQQAAGVPQTVSVTPWMSSLDQPNCSERAIQAANFKVAQMEMCGNGDRKFTVIPKVQVIGRAAYEIDPLSLSFRSAIVAGKQGVIAAYEQKDSTSGFTTTLGADTLSPSSKWWGVEQAAHKMGGIAAQVICKDAPVPAAIRGCANTSTPS